MKSSTAVDMLTLASDALDQIAARLEGARTCNAGCLCCVELCCVLELAAAARQDMAKLALKWVDDLQKERGQNG